MRLMNWPCWHPIGCMHSLRRISLIATINVWKRSISRPRRASALLWPTSLGLMGGPSSALCSHRPLLRACDLAAVQILRQVWLQQEYTAARAEDVRWRAEDDLPPGAQLILSPYNVEARWSDKRTTSWVEPKCS